MKKNIILAFFSILVFSFSALAQNSENRYSSTRLENLINQLKRQTVDLADQTSNDLNNRNSNTRTDLEAAFLAQQLDASAGFFQQMYRDGRRANELRDAGAILSDMIRRAPSGYQWRSVQTTIDDINRELGNSTGGGGGGNTDNSQVLGRVFWRGTVDARVQIIIKGNSLRVNTFAGQDYGNGNFSFTSSLPRRNVTVGFNKTKGRGDVRMVQQPSRDNDYTTIIEIVDNDSGAREYQVEIFWR